MVFEERLVGGRTAAEVVKIGETVHRSKGPNYILVREVLKLLEAKHLTGVPKWLGTDSKDREIFSYIEGNTLHGESILTDEQLVSVVNIVKNFHDATTGSKLAGEAEVICHNDLSPWNLVVNEGRPVAFIDFDDVAPGQRVDDLGYLIWTFLDLGNSEIRLVLDKIRLICRSYGYNNGKLLVAAIIKQQERILKMRRVLAQTAAVIEIENAIKLTRKNGSLIAESIEN